MNLTPHFTLEELTFSDTAQRLGIDNTPDNGVRDNLQLAANGMEMVRKLLGEPIRVNSGYRCKTLNTAIGGAKSSAHMDGLAVDFTCSNYGQPIAIVKALETGAVPFDKVIHEGTWVHISFAPAMRRMVMTAHFGPHGTTYTTGV